MGARSAGCNGRWLIELDQMGEGRQRNQERCSGAKARKVVCARLRGAECVVFVVACAQGWFRAKRTTSTQSHATRMSTRTHLLPPFSHAVVVLLAATSLLLLLRLTPNSLRSLYAGGAMNDYICLLGIISIQTWLTGRLALRFSIIVLTTTTTKRA